MAKLYRFYKCSVCGNIVEVVHSGNGTLVCCGQPMDLLVENKAEAAAEKHIPVVEKTKTGFSVKVGSIPHPMEAAHYIEWIAVHLENGKICHIYLKPGDKPEAEFLSDKLPIKAYAYCNIHELWSN